MISYIPIKSSIHCTIPVATRCLRYVAKTTSTTPIAKLQMKRFYASEIEPQKKPSWKDSFDINKLVSQTKSLLQDKKVVETLEKIKDVSLEKSKQILENLPEKQKQLQEKFNQVKEQSSGKTQQLLKQTEELVKKSEQYIKDQKLDEKVADVVKTGGKKWEETKQVAATTWEKRVELSNKAVSQLDLVKQAYDTARQHYLGKLIIDTSVDMLITKNIYFRFAYSLVNNTLKAKKAAQTYPYVKYGAVVLVIGFLYFKFQSIPLVLVAILLLAFGKFIL